MKLQIIVGSTRPNRVTPRLASWVYAQAKQMADVEAEIVDLADYDLPLFNEPGSPQFVPDRQPESAVDKWLLKLAEADAYVLVTPEYNRSTSGVLKNALDYIDFQLEKKPVALVGHGSTGGAQAISHLRGILPGLLAVTVPRATFFIGASEGLDEQGNLNQAISSKPYGPHTSIVETLSDLKWYADALSQARTTAQ
jgi:NAD(P)H-dependent FMN reductase